MWLRLGRISSASAATAAGPRQAAGCGQTPCPAAPASSARQNEAGASIRHGKLDVFHQRQRRPEPLRPGQHQHAEHDASAAQEPQQAALPAALRRPLEAARHRQPCDNRQQQVAPAQRERHAVLVAGRRDPVAPVGYEELLQVDEVVGVLQVAFEQAVELHEAALEKRRRPDAGPQAQRQSQRAELGRQQPPGLLLQRLKTTKASNSGENKNAAGWCAAITAA